MNSNLTDVLLAAMSTTPQEPIRVIDPATQQAYVLLRAEDYERMRSALEAEFALSETYTAQEQSAARAGWDDPAMDDYNPLGQTSNFPY